MSSSPSIRPLRVAVLAGGASAEREVSLRSGVAVMAALQSAGHQAIAIDPAERRLASVSWNSVDAAFVALHGGAGEDGRIQQELETLGVAYTGSGPEACRLAMSKSTAKACFEEQGVPTPAFARFDANEPAAILAARVASIGFPLVVKPDSAGSSLGVMVAETSRELQSAIAAAGRFDRTLIAESLVTGREFTLAVLNDEPLPLIEIVAADRLFSYEAKYQSSRTEYRFEFHMGDWQRVALVEAGTAATRAIGIRGLARVDLMLDRDGLPWVLEVNTSPGMTERSLAPLAAARTGLPMPALCERLVRECLSPVEVG